MINDKSTSIINASTFRIGAKIIPIVFLMFLSIFLLRFSIFNSSLLVGNDLFWHLEYGKYFIFNFSLPASDWLTWTTVGKPYQITQWLGELLLTIPAHFGGSQFVSFTVAAIGCLTLFFAWRTAAIYIANPVFSLSVALVTVFPVFTLNARPQLFGIAAFAALVWVLAEWFEHKSNWPLVAMSVIMALWVNLHGSYIVGVAYIAALGGGAWLFTFAEMKGSFIASVRVHLPLAIASFAAIFAALLNPYGWRAFESVVQISQLETTKSGVIAEWLATSLTTMHGSSFFAILFCVLFSISMAKERPSVQTVLGFIGTAYFGLIADRQTLFALVAMVPFFAQSLNGSKIEALFDKSFSTHTNPLKAFLVLVGGSMLALLIHTSVNKLIKNSFSEMYPVKAIAFLDDNKIEGKLFNKMEYGGYIESVGRKAFIDGRLDLFGDKMVLGTMDALKGKPGWDKFLAKYNPDLFILNNSDQLKELLLSRATCILIYTDEFHSIIKCSSLLN